jgi:hypothetical protein
MNAIHRISVAFVVALALIGAPLRAADFVTLSYPVAIDVEGEPLRSSVYIELQVKTYDQPLDTFAEGDLDGREARFVQWMQTLRAKDVSKAESMVAPAMSASSTGSPRAEATHVHQVDRTARQMVEMYGGESFGGLRDVNVVAQLLVGTKSVFVWESRSGQARLRRGFTVEPTGSKLTVGEVSMATPVELLIVNNVMNMLAHDLAYRGVAPVKTRYAVALATGGQASADSHPVRLQFDGEPVDISIFDNSVPAPAGIGALYRTSYRALRDGNVEQFLQHFTAHSRDKWRKWYASMPRATAEQFLTTVTDAGSLEFILDAGPFFIVFHGAPKGWSNGSLTYDYIVKPAGAGELKFANVGRHSFFDDVLGNPALFDQSALRPGATTENRTR